MADSPPDAQFPAYNKIVQHTHTHTEREREREKKGQLTKATKNNNRKNNNNHEGKKKREKVMIKQTTANNGESKARTYSLLIENEPAIQSFT